MRGFLKSLVGASAMTVSSTATGVTYLKSELRKAGCDPDTLPAPLFRDLAEHAKRYAENMAQILPDEKSVTYFVQHLEYISQALTDLLMGEPLEVDDGIAEILERYKLSFHRVQK